MNRGVKVFLSCAAGAGIGAMVALELVGFWWVGLLVGALGGYLSYDFKRLSIAVPVAWNAVSNWQPDWTALKRGFAGAFYTPMFALSWAAVVASFDRVGRDNIIISFSILLPLVCAIGFAITYSDKQMYESFCSVALRFNPLVAPFYLTYLMVKYAPKFLKKLFILIHFELRVLCAVDAAIGAAIGYAYGNALIGAIAGGLIGLFHYEVVSKRWLKLVPKPENS